MRRVEVDNVGEVMVAVGPAVRQVTSLTADLLTGLALVLEVITVTKNRNRFNLLSYNHI